MKSRPIPAGLTGPRKRAEDLATRVVARRVALRLALRVRGLVGLLLVVVSTGVTGRLLAQSFGLDWHLFGGGGGTSSGGDYALIGSIGQPNAGELAGGDFTLEGGFWPGVLDPTELVPSLYIQQVGLTAVISWWPDAPGFVLETSDDVFLATWEDAPPGNPVVVPVTAQTKFFRLRKP